jgi:hypothetical protein
MKTDTGEDIVFRHADGTIAINPVAETGVDEETGEVIFMELHASSLSVKGGTMINGRQTFKRLLIQRVYPTINIALENKKIIV